MSEHIIDKNVRIKAEPAQVWDALTDPQKTKKYFFHCEVLSTWKTGEAIAFHGKMFFIIDIEMTGQILQIEHGRVLKYTLKNGKNNDESAGYSTVTLTLNYEDGETILSVTDDVGDGDGADKRMEKSDEGWDKVLASLKELVEKETIEKED